MNYKIIKEKRVGNIKYQLRCNPEGKNFTIREYYESKMHNSDLKEIPTYGPFPNKEIALKTFEKLAGEK